METHLRVLSDQDRDQVHEKTVKILEETGVRVESDLGRDYLQKAGATVDENTRVVQIPRKVLEDSLKAAPKKFSLGARRPGWDLEMNEGECSLMIDGGAISVIDHRTREKRPSLSSDWLDATRITDSLDEIGVYWGIERILFPKLSAIGRIYSGISLNMSRMAHQQPVEVSGCWRSCRLCLVIGKPLKEPSPIPSWFVRYHH